jgi:hypothetical protein
MKIVRAGVVGVGQMGASITIAPQSRSLCSRTLDPIMARSGNSGCLGRNMAHGCYDHSGKTPVLIAR